MPSKHDPSPPHCPPPPPPSLAEHAPAVLPLPCLRADRVLVPAMKKMPTKRVFSKVNATEDSLAFSLWFDNEQGEPGGGGGGWWLGWLGRRGAAPAGGGCAVEEEGMTKLEPNQGQRDHGGAVQYE